MTSLATWLTAVGTTGATIVALYGAFVLPGREERRRRRNASCLGAIIAGAVLNDVRIGLARMTAMAAPNWQVASWKPLPSASWEGAETFPGDVVLRIIACTARKACNSDAAPAHIRARCAMYFTDTVEHINGMAEKIQQVNMSVVPVGVVGGGGPSARGLQAIAGNSIGATQDLVTLLENIKVFLEHNAKRCWPK